jgi:CheY-like chemotaxis protein
VHAPGIVPVRAAPIDREHHGRALIIEDSPELTMLIAELLRSLGYGLLHIASSEIGAIQAASAYLPDLIVGDDRIRQGSSIAAVRMICWEIPVPTVFLVADPAAFQPLSPHAVLVEQPFGKRTLRDAIDRSATLAAQLIGPLS